MSNQLLLHPYGQKIVGFDLNNFFFGGGGGGEEWAGPFLPHPRKQRDNKMLNRSLLLLLLRTNTEV